MAGEYQSPTTPGLAVTFQSFVVEHVCLNMDPRLGPRFWREDPWKSKFGRESIGVAKLVRLHGEPDDLDIRKAVIVAVRRTGAKTLLSPSALKRLDTVVRQELERLRSERERLKQKAAPEVTDVSEYMRKNTKRVVIPGSSTVLARLKAVESHGGDQGHNGV